MTSQIVSYHFRSGGFIIISISKAKVDCINVYAIIDKKEIKNGNNYLSTVIIVLQDKQVFWPDILLFREPSRKSKIPKPNYLFVREVYNEGR